MVIIFHTYIVLCIRNNFTKKKFFEIHYFWWCHQFKPEIWQIFSDLWLNFTEPLLFNQSSFKIGWPLIWELTYGSLKWNNIYLQITRTFWLSQLLQMSFLAKSTCNSCDIILTNIIEIDFLICCSYLYKDFLKIWS